MRNEARVQKEKGQPIERRRIQVRGRVQGVGFRPFVFRLATALSLKGHVGNDGHGVFIEIEGPASSLDAFSKRLRKELPPLAEISSLTTRDLSVRREKTFHIVQSRTAEGPDAAITPDAAACKDCLRELFDPDDRRYGYPFITCTNCGPRYSIIHSVPYDRPATTMARFEMCPECREEYESPADRRYHAQPVACASCGPAVWLMTQEGGLVEDDPIAACAALLRKGRIVAIKGLGGFHLACRADMPSAVRTLRERKNREAKPFALMVGNIAKAKAIAELDDAAEALLSSPACPIVLLPRKEKTSICNEVAPGSRCFGIMLPYTPLHALLFAHDPGPLVMTSGNPSAEPLCHDNDEAITRLEGLADAFLLHDRPIERPVDDSVAISLPSSKGDRGVMPLRRARGFVPDAIEIPSPAAVPVLAVGGELKSAVCFLSGRRAVLSEHLGELQSPVAYRNFIRAIDRLKELLEIEPELVACDMHPDYAATRYARALGMPLIEVQHHHAHILSCMADVGIKGPVIGISCDGTGYGLDGAVWGCEILVCEGSEFTRAGHLDYFPLPGGDAAAIDTWRPALGLLHETFGADWPKEAADHLGPLDQEALDLAAARMSGSNPLPRTSSLGRLFDGAAFLLGICGKNRFEAEAPMRLESEAWKCHGPVESLSYSLEDGGDEEPLRIDPRPLILALLEGRRAGRPIPKLAKAFHETIAAALTSNVLRISERTGIRDVALSGGCFANRLLSMRLVDMLQEDDLRVWVHRKVPPGDGGIALGQAVAAALTK